MKKLKMKKSIKKLFGIILVFGLFLSIGIYSSIKIYKQKEYEKTNEFKLLNVGYTKEEVKSILDIIWPPSIFLDSLSNTNLTLASSYVGINSGL